MSALNPWVMWALPSPLTILGRVLAASRGWRQPFGSGWSVEGTAVLLILAAVFLAVARPPRARWWPLMWTAAILKLRAEAAWWAAIGRPLP